MNNGLSIIISPLKNSNWSVKATLNEKQIVDEEVTENSLKVALLSRLNNELTADEFIRKGDANTDAYSRFMQNPYGSPIVNEWLNQEQAKNPEFRIFNNKEEFKAAQHSIFMIEKRIQNALQRAGIKPEVAQKELTKALNKII